MKKIISLLFLFSLSFNYFYAQSSNPYVDLTKKERTSLVNKNFEGLKNKSTVLIVRLPSNDKKLKELTRLAYSKELNPNEAQRMKELLVKTENITPAFNIRLMTSFDEEYEFSDILFMHDTATVALKNGKQSGFFLDKLAKSDPSIHLKNRKWVLVSLDYDGFPDAMNLNDFKTLDENSFQLPKPFPQDARMNFNSSMKLLFMKNPEEKQRFAMLEMVKKYNRRLEKAFVKSLKN